MIHVNQEAKRLKTMIRLGNAGIAPPVQAGLLARVERAIEYNTPELLEECNRVLGEFYEGSQGARIANENNNEGIG